MGDADCFQPEPYEHAASWQQPPVEGAGYVEELQRLAGLRDSGIVTDEEFEAKKKQILGI